MRNPKPIFRLLHFLLLCLLTGSQELGPEQKQLPWRMHTLFSVECQDYFDWQTVGLVHSLRKAGQPGPVTRLLSCTDEELEKYRGMNLVPTMVVPSMSKHPRTGDWYPAINKPAGVVHWLENSKDAENVDWVLILDADMIVRGPLIPWQLGAEKGQPVAAYYGYLKGCDNILAKLHTHHPELCDKVGGILAMHIDDLRKLAPLWLSKTEEVREDRAHWAENITGDIYGRGWISEMYGYSFGAAEVGLHHKINDDIMIYPGYIPRRGTEPVLMHYGLPFKVGNWSFSKLDHHEDNIVYDCNRLFPPPPFPREVELLEPNPEIKRSLYLSIECMNTLNEGLFFHHSKSGCPKPKWTKYLSFLKSKRFQDLTKPKPFKKPSIFNQLEETKRVVKIHTLFSTECSSYFDWQTVGFMHGFRSSRQPGNVTRLLSCSDEDLAKYRGHDLAPTHYVPSMNQHPLTGDWYPAINKPAAVLHWLNHVQTDAEFIVILDADMIMRGPITPWEFGAKKGHPVSTPYEYLIGCDNILAQLHTKNPNFCEKVGGVIIMHIDDLRNFALLWFHKSEEVRADKAHYATNITGDIYGSGWISEMYGYSFAAADVGGVIIMHIDDRNFALLWFYKSEEVRANKAHYATNITGDIYGSGWISDMYGYSFAAADLKLRHIIRRDIMIYPGYIPLPKTHYRVFHYGLRFTVGNWSFHKAEWREKDLVNICWAEFPDPPDPLEVGTERFNERERDLLSIECGRTLNDALYLHHKGRKCSKDHSTEEVAGGGSTGEVAGAELSGEERDERVLGSKKIKRAVWSNRIWMILLWGISVLVFLVVISLVLSRRKNEEFKSRSSRSKRKSGKTVHRNSDKNSYEIIVAKS